MPFVYSGTQKVQRLPFMSIFLCPRPWIWMFLDVAQHRAKSVHDVIIKTCCGNWKKKKKKKKKPFISIVESAPCLKRFLSAASWNLGTDRKFALVFLPSRACALLLISSASLHYSHQWCPQSIMGTYCRNQPGAQLNSAASHKPLKSLASPARLETRGLCLLLTPTTNLCSIFYLSPFLSMSSQSWAASS